MSWLVEVDTKVRLKFFYLGSGVEDDTTSILNNAEPGTSKALREGDMVKIRETEMELNFT